MILNFSLPKFRKKIEDGDKIHSIRSGTRWKPGMKIHLTIGAWTQNYTCFDKKTCTGVQLLRMLPISQKVWIDTKALEDGDISLLAKNDGFESTKDFFDFFKKSDIPGDLFIGQLVHWTDKRY